MDIKRNIMIHIEQNTKNKKNQGLSLEQHSIEDCENPNLWQNCPQCLAVSLDGTGHSKNCRLINTKSEFRHIYGASPLPLFKLRIENATDTLHILNKTSGKFEVSINNIIQLNLIFLIMFFL